MTQTSSPALTGASPSAPSSGSTMGSLAERLKAKTAQEAGEIQRMTQNELLQLQQSLNALSSDAERSMKNAMESQVGQVHRLLSDQGSQVQRLLSQQSGEIQTAMDNTTTTIVAQAQGLQDTLTGAGNLLTKALESGATVIDAKTDQLAQKLDKTNENIQTTLNKTSSTIQSQQSQIRQELRKQTKTLMWLMKLPILILVGTVALLCLSALLLTWAYLPTELFQAKTMVRQFTDGNYLVITSPEWKVCKLGNDQFVPCRKAN